MKRFSDKNNIRKLFVLIQVLLYGAFLFIDLTGGNIVLSKNIKFIIIILCFCYALFYKKNADKGIIFCLQGAMFFTLISDLFLLILDFYFYGVLTFILVQQLYGMRNRIVLSTHHRSHRSLFLGRSFLLCASIQLFVTGMISMILMQLGVKPEKLLLASVFYFICIATNVVMAIKAAVLIPNRANLLFAAGMLLFLLCDINVGLFNIADFISLPEDVYHFLYTCSTVLMWTFYAPSQVLLVLSGEALSANVIKTHKNFV